MIFSQISSIAKSIILTSGTLSPMDSFASELGCEFAFKLEASHVIPSEQVFVTHLPAAADGYVMKGFVLLTQARTKTQVACATRMQWARLCCVSLKSFPKVCFSFLFV